MGGEEEEGRKETGQRRPRSGRRGRRREKGKDERKGYREGERRAKGDVERRVGEKEEK